MKRDERDERDPRATRTWRAPTRRAFVAMIGAAATALAVERPLRTALTRGDDDPDRARRTATGTTRWIGHC